MDHFGRDVRTYGHGVEVNGDIDCLVPAIAHVDAQEVADVHSQ